jgi:hypothetical protein
MNFLNIKGFTDTLIFRDVTDVFYDNFTSSEYANGNGSYYLGESLLGYPMDCYYRGDDNATATFHKKYDLYGFIFQIVSSGFVFLICALTLCYFFLVCREEL